MPLGYPYGYPYATPQRTNGMAVASMVVSIVAAAATPCTYGLSGFLGILGAILGHVSRRQIEARRESGGGMALAGVIVGWIAVALGVAGVAVIIFLVWALNEPHL